MLPISIDLDDHTKGDTWEGLAIGPVLFNNTTPSFPLSGCRLHFRDGAGVLGYGLSSDVISGYGTITISASATWEIDVPEQTLDLTAGSWCWDFETTDTNSVVRTLYKGTLKIVEDCTY